MAETAGRGASCRTAASGVSAQWAAEVVFAPCEALIAPVSFQLRLLRDCLPALGGN